jgi:hypothetical protein
VSSTPKRQLDPSILGVIHRAGTTWRAVIARNMDNRNAGLPTIIGSREFPEGQANEIDAWMDQHDVSQVLCVLPASAIICRSCSLPDASSEHLEAALRLQAEAHLHGIAPAHRISMAVLEAAPQENSRAGIILAWPESADIDLPRLTRPVTYTSDVASIAAIISNQRPSEPVIWLDRADGSVALAISHSNGVAFRSVREDVEDADAWQTGVGRVLAETSMNAGHTPEFVESLISTTQNQMSSIAHGDGRLLVPQSIIDHASKRVASTTNDRTWWERFGVAAGALLVRSSSLAELSQLAAAAPSDSPSRIRDTLEQFSTPTMAKRLAIACVLVLMFGPMVTHWARYHVLQWRHTDLMSQLRLVNQAKDQLVVYRELGNNAWPMTKILSDIASNTPEGVELETIRIAPSRTFTVRGRAIPHNGLAATEVVVLMQQYLRDSEIFNEITLNWGDSDSFGHYEFELSARLLRPYRKHDYPDDLDFATWTVVDRRDGRLPGWTATLVSEESTTETPTSERTDDPGTEPVRAGDRPALVDGESGRPPAEDPDETYAPRDAVVRSDESGSSSGSRIDRPRSSISGALGGGASTRDDVRGESGIAPHQDIPDPMTQAQINAMTEAEVDQMLTRVSYARNAARARNNTELEERLRQEFQWLVARKRDFS